MAEQDKRGTGYSNGFEYFLTNLGFAVGLGNLWRFPYQCYVNGGGTFLVPYCIMLVIVGLPCYFSDLAVGQFTGSSPSRIFGRIAPAFKGLGYGIMIIPFLISSYYTVIMAYSFLYLCYGFLNPIPWSSCDNENFHGSYFCSSKVESDQCEGPDTMVYYNHTCQTITQFCDQFSLTVSNDHKACWNQSYRVETYNSSLGLFNPQEDFWYNTVLGLHVQGDHLISTWSEWGDVRWYLVATLLLSWILIYASLMGGTKAYGKFAYVLTLSPYVVLTILLIYISTKDGFSDGIDYYMTPDWEKLKEFEVSKLFYRDANNLVIRRSF